MKDSIYVIVTKRGIDRQYKDHSRMTLNPGEKAIKVEIEVPDSVFSPTSIPTIRMSVPAEMMIHEIDLTVANVPDKETSEVYNPRANGDNGK